MECTYCQFLRARWSINIQRWKASPQIYLLGYWALQPLLERVGSVWVCECVAGVKNVKYSVSEGCSINLATLTFFNLDWQVNCLDGNILSSSRFLSIPLRSRVALHHVCQRGLYWRTLRPDWMLGTHWCVWKWVCMGYWWWSDYIEFAGIWVSLSLTSHVLSQIMRFNSFL